MEKLTHFLWAKVVAVILCIVSAFCACGTLVLFAISANYSEGELLDELYQSAADNYAASIVDHYEKARDQNKNQALSMFDGTSLNYAVVKSNSIDITQKGLSPQNWGTYLYGTPETAKDYTYHFISAPEDADGQYSYNTSSILSGLGMGDFTNYAQQIAVKEEIIRDVVYAKDTGLFYVVTDQAFILVRSLMIGYEKYDSSYDGAAFDGYSCYYIDDLDRPYYIDDDYRIVTLDLSQDCEYTLIIDDCNSVLRIVREEHILSDADEVPESEGFDAAQQTVGEIADIDILSGETTTADVWNNRDIHVVECLPEDANVYQTGYRDISGSIVYYEIDESDSGEEETFYHVLSYVNPDMACKGDLFDQARQINNLVQAAARYGTLVEVVFISLAIASFIFLMYAAGKRRGDNEIHLRIWDRMFFEIYTAGMFAIELLLFVGTILLLDEVENDFLLYHLVTMGVQAAAVFAVIAIVYCMGLAVRIKSKNFWNYTLVYRICRWIKRKKDRFVQKFHENPSLMKKTIWILAAWFAIEFFTLIVFLVFGCAFTNGVFSVLVWLFLSFVVKAVIIIGVIMELDQLRRGAERLANGDFEHPIDTSRMVWEIKKHGDNLNAVGDGFSLAVAKQMKSEHFKTELITNVSHDIKTPLTSIINYVDLLEKENIDSPKAKEYIEVLERQSNRLKKLIEDLMEASKASTGNLAVHLEKLEADVFLVQTVGEFEEKTKAAGLDLIIKKPEEPVTVLADSRHFWRVIDNLMNNICKYAQPDTRVYIDLEKKGESVFVIFKNTSKTQLNISSEELMERFVRGDSSRNTEGNGLGLSIARSLMELMKGELTLVVDGDLFKVTLRFNS